MGLIKLYRSGFTKGINPYQETQDETGMDFDILIMDDGDTFEISDKDKEIALVIIEGAGTITFEDKPQRIGVKAINNIRALTI